MKESASMLTADALDLSGIRHGFFTRHGGVSGGLYASLNIGLGSQDARENVLENRARVAERMGVARDNLAMPYQHHSADAAVVQTVWPVGAQPKADAMVTSVPGIALGISTADCGPVLFADAEAGVVGAAHAGWRGALGGVLESTLAAMEELGANRDRTVAVLGPTISAEAYEVGPEFLDAFLAKDPANETFFTGGPNGRPLFDLPAYILHRLEAAGVGRAESLGRCTYREADTFFSYRRATHHGEADYGRLVSAIAIDDQGRT